MTERLQFASAGMVPPKIAARHALAERAAAERRQVGGTDSLVERVKRGEEDRPWWMEQV
jgi:hypothetical protein